MNAIDTFQPMATDAPPFLKQGIYGDPGSGKTYTATLVAIGLALRIKRLTGKAPPIMFLDTEKGAIWVKRMVEGAGLTFLAKETRAFKDLVPAVWEAERRNAILITDSVSHFWENLREGYLKAKRLRIGNSNAGLVIGDWNFIKPAWGRFTAAFLNSKCHIILCGRGASMYDFQTNDETGKKEMITTGTRMAAEKGMGYEPHILVEMTQHQLVSPRNGKSVVHLATVLKDRSTALNGKIFEEPTFDSFLPHIEELALGGELSPIDMSENADGMFPIEGGEGRDVRSTQREIVCEEICNLLMKHHPSAQKTEDKLARIRLVAEHFKGNPTAWVEVEKLMPLEDLRIGYDRLHRHLEKDADGEDIPSRYARTACVVAELERGAKIDDEIPEFADAPESPGVAAAEPEVTRTVTQAPAEPSQQAQQEAAPVEAPVLVEATTAVPTVPRVGKLSPQDEVVEDFRATVAGAMNATRINTVWKQFKPRYDLLDDARQRVMLTIKAQAEGRAARAREAALSEQLHAAE